jgi:hypothetical protein
MKSRKSNSFSNNSHPCLYVLYADLFCAVNVTPVFQYAVYWSALRSTCHSRASVCCLLIFSAQYMSLPCFSMLSTDLFCAVHVTPVLQYAVYWSVLRSKCDSRVSVCCLLICSAQYMWLPCFSILSTDLFHTARVALSHYSVHWCAVCSTRGSCPLTCCMQYTWLMSIDLLYAVRVTHVHWSAVCCTRNSRHIYLLYAVHVAQTHWSAVRSTCDYRVSICYPLIVCTQYR